MKAVKQKENFVESYLCARVAELGGACEKVQVIGSRGFFDRLVVLPNGVVYFIECKRPRGGVMSPHQLQRHALYSALGATVVVVKNREDIDRLLPRIKTAG